MEDKTTVSGYLLKRLEELGVRHIFGVPGDYVLDFMDRILESPLKLVGTCNELNAGYAADGYARANGIGAAVVTYGVGGFSICNAIAGAYAEQVPVVLISGSPHSSQRKSHRLVHHLTKDYFLQYDVFRKLTVDAAMLTDPAAAPAEIDRVLKNCVSMKRPVYIEIPADMVSAPCAGPQPLDLKIDHHSDPDFLTEAVKECAELINAAESPVVIAGVELHRFGLAGAAMALIEKIEIPYATTINSKSVLPELHPQFIGVYQGALSRNFVREQIEKSDCVVALGVWLNDFNTGGFSSKLDEGRLINVTSESFRIKHHEYPNIWLGDFICELAGALKPRSYIASHPLAHHYPSCGYDPGKGRAITAKRFYERINSFLKDDMILLTETGDAICAAPAFYIQEPDNFIAQAYYLSIGYCIPAALGVSLARPDKRAIVLEGDGAFQMTAQELSTIIRNKCNPVIFLLNNKGYVIERLIHDGPYNDIQEWKYHRLPEVFGGGALSFNVRTEDELEDALLKAMAETAKTVFVEVHFDPSDCSEALAGIADKIRSLSK